MRALVVTRARWAGHLADYAGCVPAMSVSSSASIVSASVTVLGKFANALGVHPADLIRRRPR